MWMQMLSVREEKKYPALTTSCLQCQMEEDQLSHDDRTKQSLSKLACNNN